MINWLKKQLDGVWMGAIAARRASAMIARQRVEALRREYGEDPLSLIPYGFSGYSQNDEDGILQEIFRRIGTTNRRFVEFGCGDGLENNSAYLLMSGWTGVWMDGSAANVESARRHHAEAIAEGGLVCESRMITAENVEGLIADREPDLLSIDVDGNDYWIWKALERVRPRVLVIEYNATFRPPVAVVQPYRPDAVWNETNFFGASLAALAELGRSKGMSLVGCNLSGVNAFFVRSDLTGDLFLEPGNAARHYREADFDLFAYWKASGHAVGAGRYEIL